MAISKKKYKNKLRLLVTSCVIELSDQGGQIQNSTKFFHYDEE